MQMLSGGAGLLAASIFSGQVSRFHPSQVSAQSWVALAYLTVAGSIAAFTAYSWLLKATAPAQAATYAYVNPVVAVFLGWAIAGEPLTARALAAMTMIVLAVIVITTARPRVQKLLNDAEAPKRSFIYSQ
jgi:drug/metabolite transporter (DMT)-like permease